MGQRGAASPAIEDIQDISAKRLDTGFDPALLDEFLRVLKTPNLIVFCSRLQLRDFLNWSAGHDLKWALICWHKTNPTPLTNNNYLPDTEYVFHFWRGKKLRGRYQTKRRYYVQAVEKNGFAHPTVKPLGIVKNLIENASDVGDVVLDPFVGSGTTALAAKQLNRRYIGIERDRDYFEIARRRLAQALPTAAE